ncbi:MAG: hypothetical protein GC168_16990 [Candidatus Hydrogenedens sp.]|nr:hypothetical protein [Candidatus Hydrogenedens sp.]
MKKVTGMICGAAAAAVMALAVLAVPAHAEGALTEKLQGMVSSLSDEQQAALLLLLNSMGGEKSAEAPAAAADAGGSPEEQFKSAVKMIKQAAIDENVDAVMDLISDDFDHYQVGGKKELRDFIQNAIDMGYVSMYAKDIEILTDDTEFEKDGDEIVIYPVDVEGAFGTVTLEFVVKEEGGKYKITTLDISGI